MALRIGKERNINHIIGEIERRNSADGLDLWWNSEFLENTRFCEV